MQDFFNTLGIESIPNINLKGKLKRGFKKTSANLIADVVQSGGLDNWIKEKNKRASERAAEIAKLRKDISTDDFYKRFDLAKAVLTKSPNVLQKLAETRIGLGIGVGPGGRLVTSDGKALTTKAGTTDIEKRMIGVMKKIWGLAVSIYRAEKYIVNEDVRNARKAAMTEEEKEYRYTQGLLNSIARSGSAAGFGEKTIENENKRNERLNVMRGLLTRIGTNLKKLSTPLSEEDKLSITTGLAL